MRTTLDDGSSSGESVSRPGDRDHVGSAARSGAAVSGRRYRWGGVGPFGGADPGGFMVIGAWVVLAAAAMGQPPAPGTQLDEGVTLRVYRVEPDLEKLPRLV